MFRGEKVRLILICGFFWSSLSLGDSPALPVSYAVESENEKYIFVMLSPLSKEQELSSLNAEWGEKTSKIRNKYSVSGMYPKDGSSELMWGVSWYAHSIEIANDGELIVRAGPWASSFDDEAVTFIKRGEVLKSYKIKELVKKKRKVERTVSHFFWRDETLFDRKQLKYYISTLDSKHYIFNVGDGEIIAGTK
jgi:hypothetical protein